MVKRESDNMKRTVSGLLILVLSVVLLSGCNNKFSGYIDISYDKFEAKKENKDNFALVIGSSTCSACASYEITMNQFIEDYSVEVFYIDISKLDESQYNNLKTEVSFTGTPTTVFYEYGKLTSYYNRLDGAEDINNVINIFKENGYLE